MKIVFVSSAQGKAHEQYEKGDLSGTESQVLGNLEEFRNRGHDVIILRRTDDERAEKTHNGIQIIDVQSPGFPDSMLKNAVTQLYFSHRVRREIQKIEPDIVNVISKYSSYFACDTKYPTVHFAFNNPAQITPGKGPIVSRLTKHVEQKIANSVEALVTRNKRTEQFWEEESLEASIHRIPCAVHPNRLESLDEDGTILYGGRLSPEKGVRYLIDAYANLPTELRDEHPLKIVGEGSERMALEKRVEELGISEAVCFRPWLPKTEFYRELGSCSVYVLPSLYEGMPVALLEAMGCSKPIVASDIAGIRDVVNDGVTGYLFEPKDVEHLQTQLERILSDTVHRRSLGDSARSLVTDQFSFEQVATEYLSLYCSLLN